MRGFLTIARRLMQRNDGNVVVLAAFILPIVLAVGGYAVDSGAAMNQKSHLQSFADAAALAGARELLVVNAKEESVVAAIKTRADIQLGSGRVGAESRRVVEATADMNTRTVRVAIKEMAVAVFAGLPLVPSAREIHVVSEARAYGHARICLLGLNEKKSDTVYADNGSKLSAPGCVAYSNAKDKNGMVSKNSAMLEAAMIGTAGGYDGSGFSPMPVTDVPGVGDPLADRPAPPYSGCDFRDFKSKKKQTLSPGVYCGGLTLEGGADVTLSPGVYVIAEGKLEVKNEAKMKGQDVGFYFADDAATLVFDDKATVDLSAPKDGPMAGLLIFENRDAAPDRNFKITSRFAHNLLGTIYLPKGHLEIDAPGSVAQASAYTVIIADSVKLKKGTNLVLNSDYASTEVPVPAGLGPTSGVTYLSR